MSFHSETPQMNRRNNPSRIAPSTRLKAIRPPSAGSIFFSSVAARSGMYLYMKMKNATENAMLTAASQLLRVAAFSRASDFEGCFGEDCFGDDSATLRASGTAEAAVSA